MLLVLFSFWTPSCWILGHLGLSFVCLTFYFIQSNTLNFLLYPWRIPYLNLPGTVMSLVHYPEDRNPKGILWAKWDPQLILFLLGRNTEQHSSYHVNISLGKYFLWKSNHNLLNTYVWQILYQIFFKFYMRGILSPHFREHPNKHAKQGHCSISSQIRSVLLYCVSSIRKWYKIGTELQDFTAEQNRHGDF